MGTLKIGDRVKIKVRDKWWSPVGFRLGNSKGVVVPWFDCPEAMNGFEDYYCVCIDKAEGEAEPFIGVTMGFTEDHIEKL
jgi:hypothetical protein